MSNFQRFRENINLRLYKSKDKVLYRFKFFSLVVSAIAILALVVNYGYKLDSQVSHFMLAIIRSSFAFYVLRYLVRILYNFEPLKFIKSTWYEAAVMVFLILEGISYTLFDSVIGESLFGVRSGRGIGALSNLFIQFYLLVVVALELGKSGDLVPRIKIHPSYIFILSFAGLIAVGTLLLMLPEMTTIEGSMLFIDALFTSTSATCVTGLIVVDTSTYFTFKGHLVLLALMKIGGINIVSFGTFLALLSRLGIGIKHHSVIEDFVNKESIFSARGMLSKIILVGTLIELVGAILIFVLISGKQAFLPLGDRIFFSIFHAVSAFNNAGFSTLGSGLFTEYVRGMFYFHIVLGLLIFFGSLGFTSIFDLFTPSNIRERLKARWKKPHLSTKLSLYSSLILIGVGAVLYFIFEYNNSLGWIEGGGKVVASLFQSISLRTAGFNTVDLTNLSYPILIFCIFLMFIGGASSSTAGGIKTSTFSVVILSAFNTIRGKENIEIFKKTIPKDIVFRSYSIFIFALGGIITGIFLLTITEAHLFAQGYTIMDIIFEETSAFSTVGASTGITPLLSSAGKLILIFSMFIGRLGTLTVAFALSKNVISTKYKYPDEHMMIG